MNTLERSILTWTKLLLVTMTILSVIGCTSKNTNETNPEPLSAQTLKSEPVDPEPNVRGYIEFTGIVVYSPEQDGFYYLKAARNIYDPNSLPKKFQKNGLAVRVKARIRNDQSKRLSGPMVQIIKIDLISPIILTP